MRKILIVDDELSVRDPFFFCHSHETCLREVRPRESAERGRGIQSFRLVCHPAGGGMIFRLRGNDDFFKKPSILNLLI